MSDYLETQKIDLIFVGEDCTAVAPPEKYMTLNQTHLLVSDLLLKMACQKSIPFQLNRFLNSKNSLIH